MRSIAITLLMLVGCAGVWAQSTAQISGTVHDASGSSVAGAQITATQTATGAVRTVTSAADGGYILPNLPIGPYMLEVAKSGFSRYVQSGIVLQVDSDATVDATLSVGAVNEQVTVQADAAMVETHSTGVGQVVDSQRVAEMPLNGRNPIELVFLAGLASTAGGVGALNTVRNYPTVIVSVAGGQGNGITYLLDGANYQDPYNSGSLPLPFPDALQEFKVETSALPAQYGFHSGAAVNAVTKSGTNGFHGDLFEFLRNGDFNARDFFATSRDTLKRNQFGGTAGGRIIKDKLFYFGGYQRTSQRSDPSSVTAFIPTPTMLAGDFSAVASVACQGKQVTLPAAQGFAGNKVATSLLNPVALNIVKTMQVTNDPCGKVVFGKVANQDEDLYAAKIDYQQSSKSSYFGRLTLANLNVGSTFDGKNPLSIDTFGVHDLDYSVALGNTYLIGSNIVSSLRVAMNRTNIVKLNDHFQNLRDFGSNVTPGPGVKSLYMTVTNAFGIGTSAAVPGASHNGPNPSIAEDLGIVKGSHQMGFGVSWYRQMMNYESGLNTMGLFTFNGSVTGLALSDFLLGQAVSFNEGNAYGFYNRQNYLSLYAQDNWKMTPRLTVNLGVRWEPYTAPFSKFGQFSHFDQGLFNQNFHSTVFPNAPAGLAFPGDPQYKCGNSLNCGSWDKFFPRVGVVWDPAGDGKMTIRASYGIFGDRPHMFYSNFISQYAPFGNNIGLANVNLSNPWAGYPGGDPIPSITATTGIGHVSSSTTFPLASTYVIHRTDDYHAPYLNQWNLSIQRQVGRDWLVQANYLGNSTIHLTSSYQVNPAVFLGLGQCTINGVSYATCSTTANQQQRRVLSLQNPAQGQFYSSIGQADDGGTGSYNALFLSVQKRLSKGVSVLANYTWSHCISDVFDPQTSATTGAPPGDRLPFRGNCQGSDLRQLFNLNMVAATPRFSNKVLRILASDWQISPILQIKSAQFFSVYSGTDRALTNVLTTTQTANLVGSNEYAADKSVDGWLNPSAFAIPALGTYGNMGYNNMKGPGIFQLNVGLARTFAVWEKRTVQVRAEAFNLPNHLNPSVPVSALNSGIFGQITSDISGNNGLSAGDPRIVQFAMKFVF